MRILFFIGTLLSGGKERRLIELLSYLKKYTNHEMMVLLRRDQVDYPTFYELDIPYKLLTEKYKKKDSTLHLKFYKICKGFRPDIIHTWGSMQAFVSLLAIILLKIPHVNSQITEAPPQIKKLSLSNIVNRINFYFSSIILSNSKAGIESFKPPLKKCQVIYNGANPERFVDLPSIKDIKRKYGINTFYSVVMVASFTPGKDYDLFFKIAEYIISLRDNITFIGAGGPVQDESVFKRLNYLAKDNPMILFPGRINDVEALVNACDIGILLTNKAIHGEGIPNSVLEYMALGKAVIANDAGGTKELVRHNENGYLITNETFEGIAEMIMEFIDDPEKRKAFGKRGKEIVDEYFTLEKIGKAFEKIYCDLHS